jgi:hypothetical protein
MKEETIDMLLFIYINSRSLRKARREDDWATKNFRERFHKLLLNIEDDFVDGNPGDNATEVIRVEIAE